MPVVDDMSGGPRQERPAAPLSHATLQHLDHFGREVRAPSADMGSQPGGEDKEAVDIFWGPVSSESPVLNPRLSWPRIDPCSFPIMPPRLDAEALPPTQRFEVHLRHCHQQVVISDSPLEDCPKREWTQGGLNGGCKLDFCPLSTTLRNLDGWWIGIQGVRWQQIPIESVAGRTVRQEREMLGLMGVDTTSTAMIGFSDEGPFKVPWNYKFPSLCPGPSGHCGHSG